MLASRSGIAVAVATAVLSTSIVMAVRVVLSQIEPWTLMTREIDGAIADIRKRAHELPVSADVERARADANNQAIARRLDVIEERMATVGVVEPTGIRLAGPSEAGITEGESATTAAARRGAR
jgi:hypothetical protein